MPPETKNHRRISLLIQAYAAGLVDLTEADKKDIATVLKHPLKA
jgi:hypothetical protein